MIAGKLKKGSAFQGCHGGEATGSYLFVIALHGHSLEREMPTGGKRKRDQECNSLLRAEIGLTDGCTDTLKRQ